MDDAETADTPTPAATKLTREDRLNALTGLGILSILLALGIYVGYLIWGV